MKVHLQKAPRLRKGIPWTSCEPFVENTRATLIHRVRHVTTHKIGDRWKPHIAVHMWCGNSVCPPLARALVAVNYADQTAERKAA